MDHTPHSHHSRLVQGLTTSEVHCGRLLCSEAGMAGTRLAHSRYRVPASHPGQARACSRTRVRRGMGQGQSGGRQEATSVLAWIEPAGGGQWSPHSEVSTLLPRTGLVSRAPSPSGALHLPGAAAAGGVARLVPTDRTGDSPQRPQTREGKKQPKCQRPPGA